MYQRQTSQRQPHQRQSYQQQPQQQQPLKALRDLTAYDTKIQVSGTIKFAEDYQIDNDNDGNVDTDLPDSLKTIDDILAIIQKSITTENLTNLRNRYITYYNNLLNGIYNLLTKYSPYFKYFNEWYFRRQWYSKINSLTNQDQNLKLVDEKYPPQLQLTVLPSVQIIKCTDVDVLNSINNHPDIGQYKYEIVFFDSNNILQEGIYVFDKNRMELTPEEQEKLKNNGHFINQLDPPTYYSGYFIKTRVVQSKQSDDQPGDPSNGEKWRQGYVFYNGLAGNTDRIFITFDIFEYSVNNGEIIKDTVIKLDDAEIYKMDINLWGQPDQPSSKKIYKYQPSPTWPIYANERDDSQPLDDTTRVYCFMNDNVNRKEKNVEYVFNIGGSINTYPYTHSHFQVFYVVGFTDNNSGSGEYTITHSNIFYKKRASVETYDNLVLINKKTDEQPVEQQKDQEENKT